MSLAWCMDLEFLCGLILGGTAGIGLSAGGLILIIWLLDRWKR